MNTYRDLHPVFPNRADWNLPHILRQRARTHAEKVYVRAPLSGAQYTYAETYRLAMAVAASLIDAGGRPGDRILIMAPNCPEYLFAWFGAALAGMVEVPINTAYRGSFLEHQVRVVQPRFAVIDVALAERFVESAAACRSIERFYLLGEAGAAREAAAVLTGAGWPAAPFATLYAGRPGALPAVTMRDLASVFFTSGTTGPSKGVMMPQAQMAFFAEECVSLTRLTENDVYMSVGPLFHGNAQFLAAYPALIAGAEFALYEKFSASQWSGWLHQSGATVTNFVGVMMDFVWKQAPRPEDAENCLRCVFAAPTAHSYLRAFQERFGIEAFVEVFGLTETAMPIMTPYGAERPAGAAGLLVEDWFDIRLVDSETDEEVPTGRLGELVVRAKQPWTTCLGYFGMPDRTAEAFRNLWFHTGDGLKRDEGGWYYFVDRLKDALRRRGENISSFEVEQAILADERIAECAVVAVPAESEAGEDEVMLFAVPAAGARLTPEDIWRWCDRRLPYFAVPRYIRFLEALPRTPSEKIQKRLLRERGVDGETADRYRSAGERRTADDRRAGR